MKGNSRNCKKCEEPIDTTKAMFDLVGPAEIAAWLAGFCTPQCEMDYAVETFDAGAAWWQK